MSVAADADGHILGVRVDQVEDVGAYRSRQRRHAPAARIA